MHLTSHDVKKFPYLSKETLCLQNTLHQIMKKHTYLQRFHGNKKKTCILVICCDNVFTRESTLCISNTYIV